MKIHNFEQGTPEWHAARLGKFTASEIHRLIFKKDKLTEGNITYVIEKVTEHFEKEPANDFESYWMDRGKQIEGNARALYYLSFGVEIENVGFIEYGEHAGVSIDGFVNSDGQVEIKCPKKTTHYRYLNIQNVKDIPINYYLQMQMQMLVTEREWCDFVSYHPEAAFRMFRFRVYRDSDDIELIKTCLDAGIEYKEKMIANISLLQKY
jgi:exodeoxyribonuclease (lambda-induced)